MVKANSVERQPDGVSIAFVVTDGAAEIPVRFRGITPELFREGKGVIAEGRFQPDRSFVATEILARHDENYMPDELEKAGSRHKTETLE